MKIANLALKNVEREMDRNIWKYNLETVENTLIRMRGNAKWEVRK